MFIDDDDVTYTVVGKPNNNTEEAREALNLSYRFVSWHLKVSYT